MPLALEVGASADMYHNQQAHTRGPALNHISFLCYSSSIRCLVSEDAVLSLSPPRFLFSFNCGCALNSKKKTNLNDFDEST